MSQFEYGDSPQRPRNVGPSWFHTFSATLAAVVLGGAILIVGLRFYIQWSLASGIEDARKAIQQSRENANKK